MRSNCESASVTETKFDVRVSDPSTIHFFFFSLSLSLTIFDQSMEIYYSHVGQSVCVVSNVNAVPVSNVGSWQYSMC